MTLFPTIWFREKELAPIDRPIFLEDYAKKYGMREEVVLSYFKKGTIPGQLADGRIVLEDRSLEELRAVAQMTASMTPSSRYTRPMSWREVVLSLSGAAALLLVAYYLRQDFYPWLGIPVIGLSGLAPIILSIIFAVYLLRQVNYLNKYEALSWPIAGVLGTLLCLFLLWSYAKLFGRL